MWALRAFLEARSSAGLRFRDTLSGRAGALLTTRAPRSTLEREEVVEWGSWRPVRRAWVSFLPDMVSACRFWTLALFLYRDKVSSWLSSLAPILRWTEFCWLRSVVWDACLCSSERLFLIGDLIWGTDLSSLTDMYTEKPKSLLWDSPSFESLLTDLSKIRSSTLLLPIEFLV